jgi:outer membrane lipoprotein
MKRLLLLVIPTLLLMAGCARVISENSMRLVDTNITFSMLRENPEAYVGNYVLLGGTIAGVRNTNEGAVLEVNQYELNFAQTPKVSGQSGGLFLATTDAFLDPFIYKSGLKVTTAGKVLGKRTVSHDGEQYVCPVIAVREMYLFREMPSGQVYYLDSIGTYRYGSPRKEP